MNNRKRALWTQWISSPVASLMFRPVDSGLVFRYSRIGVFRAFLGRIIYVLFVGFSL